MEIDRFLHLAAAHDVPVGEMGPLPVLPDLPGQAWIEFRQNMTDLKPVVVTRPPVQQGGAVA